MSANDPKPAGDAPDSNPGTEIFRALENRIGLGLLRLTTEGRPADIDALAVINFALKQGIRVLDTADVYSLGEEDLHYGEHLVRQAIAGWNGPADEIRVLTKVGMTRPNGRWVPNGRPDHLRKSVEGSLKALDVERLFLLQLHVRDPRTPFEDTLAALAELQQEGLVEHLGLCNVSPDELKQAGRHFTVATVQNELSVLNRKSSSDGMLALTAELGIPFLAHRPLGGHAKVARLLKSPILVPLAERHQATVHEIALAALMAAGTHIVPLVGATRMASIRSSLRALNISLDISDKTALSIGFSFAPAATSAVAQTQSQDISALSAEYGPGDDPEVVLLMGIQGAGKSELVQRYLEKGYVRLNRDQLGGKLDDLVPRMVQHLTEGQNRIVLDNTYPTRLSRAPVIAAAHAHGVPVRCRHLQTPMTEAWINIVHRMVAKYGMPLGPREMKVFRKADANLPPPQALARWAACFEPPQLDEGFAAIDVIPFVRRVDPTHTQKGLLLDVDGTLRRTRSGEFYPRHPDDVELLPNRREVLAKWIEAGYQLFFVSNQSGLSTGHVSHDAVQASMMRTSELLDLPINEIVYCPHPSQPVGCFCRKPMPGLGVYLMQRHQLAREHLVMVGDMDSDAEFAAALGARYFDAAEFFC